MSKYVKRDMMMEDIRQSFKEINEKLQTKKITNEDIRYIFYRVQDYFTALNLPKDKIDYNYDLKEIEVRKEYEKLIQNKDFLLAKQNYALSNNHIHKRKLSDLSQILFKNIRTKKFDTYYYHGRRYSTFIENIYKIGVELDILLNIEGMIINIEDIALIKNIILVLKEYLSLELKERIIRIEENENLKKQTKTYNKYKKQNKIIIKRQVDKPIENKYNHF